MANEAGLKVGKVVQIRSAPVITQNVVTYVVVVNVNNSDLKLKPGMTANVAIQVAKKDDILKIPPAALRFKPKGGAEKGDTAAKESKPTTGGAAQGRPGGKPGERKGGSQQVYVLKDGKPVPVPVKTGISGSGSIELLEGGFKEGDEVIVEQKGGEQKKSGSSSSPMGRPF